MQQVSHLFIRTSLVFINDAYFGTGINRGSPDARISLLGTLSFSRRPAHQQHRKLSPVPKPSTLLTVHCCTCRRSFSRAFYTDTIQPSTVASSSARYLNTLACAKFPSVASYLSSEESSHLVYDGVQVSRDGTPAPILAQHGPSVPLYTITFSSTPPPPTASTSTTSSNSKARRLPSLLHLSLLLLTIRTHFPSYALLEHQCYFFARVTCLTLIDLFGGVKKELEEGQRAAT
jgi:hypothetical protein